MGPLVTAVIVSHDGQRWLPTLLHGLSCQQRAPDRVVAVDTASADGSLSLLEAALGTDAVIRGGRADGYGKALGLGVEAADRLDPASARFPLEDRWLWLLPDDCAPAPGALRALLQAAADDPAAGVLGAKVREWPDGLRLFSVGTAITGTGRRESGVDPGELDQGQHDAVRPVLAVDSAGMLVRRDVWDQLGGFDRRLPLFRDDVDFGWRAARAGHRVLVCPQAVVFHAEAAARGLRPISNTSPRPHRADRRAALFTLLANCRGAALPFVAVRLLTGCLLRALGFLLGKAPRLTVDELAALGAVLTRPGAVIDARRERRRTARVPPSAVHPLLPPWWLPYRRGLDTVADRLLAGRPPPAAHVRHRAGTETGPVAEEAENLPAEPGALAGALRRPYTLAVLATLAAALLAGRQLAGSGLLQGGALLPAPDGAGDLWSAYLSSWHPVGLGSDTPAPPYLVLLAGMSVVLGGKPWLAVDVVFLLAVPLAATTAYLASRRWIGSPVVRAWLAVGYGLLPVLTGAVAQGRLGTVAASIVAPLAVRSAVLLFTARPRRHEYADPRWRAAFATALWLAVALVLVPASYPLALAALGCVAVALVRSATAAAQVLVAAVLPALLALPWTLALLAEPDRWLTEAGAADPLELGVPAQGLQLLLGRPGGPGAAPGWIGAGVLVAAVAALLRRDRRAAVSVAWAVGLVALAAAVATSGRVGGLPQLPDGFVAWPGFAVTVAFAAALSAAALAADGAASALAGGSFGWRQPLAAGLALAAGAAPVLGLGWWLAAGTAGPLHRGPAVDLPAYLVAAHLTPARPRTLLVDTAARPAVTYQLVRDDGMRTGEEWLAPPARDSATLDALVARLVSDPTDADARALADYAVASLVLAAPVDPRIAAGLDALPALERASAGSGGAAAWRLAAPVGRARLLPSPPSPRAAVLLPSGPVTVRAPVPPGPPPRAVALAETTDQGWQATLDGAALPAVQFPGWGQRFGVGAREGALVVGHDDAGRRGWLLGQLGLLVLAVVLAGPGLRRTSAGLSP